MTKIAIASCCKVQMQHDQPAWAAIESENPDQLLLLGDNVYMLNDRWDHAYLRDRYVDQLAVPEFASVISNVPYMAIWDDHDFGVNDSRGAYVSYSRKRRSRDLFHQYLPGAINPDRPRIYTSHVINDVKIIMLDVRTWRTYSNRIDATMLGDDQEQWLWNELQHPHRFTVIGTGSCVSAGADRETWKDFDRFYSEFLNRVPSRTLVVSGDIHKNAFQSHQGFFEATSSGIGRKTKPSGGRPAVPMNNYGIITFGNQRVTIDLRGDQAANQIRKQIRVSNWSLI